MIARQCTTELSRWPDDCRESASIRNDTGGVGGQAGLYRSDERSPGPLRDSGLTNEQTMTTFDDRKDAFEKKFAHDEELRFKAMARRNKLLGLWAAEKLGKTGADADAYAKSVVLADFEEPGDEDVFRKVRGDLDAAVTDQEIREKMTALLAEAAASVQRGE